MREAVVLGAGIVGVSVALHLQERGWSVLLVDRREPGQETSSGNAGIIQSEGIRPRSFPRGAGEIWKVVRGAGLDARYDWRALPGLARPFALYWRNSAPRAYEAIVRDYAPLIRAARDEHARLIDASGSEALVRRQGWMLVFRSETARDAAFALADAAYAPYGVGYRKLAGAELTRAEPDLQQDLAGALHWTDPWTITDPGALVTAYARLFAARGGAIRRAEATALRPHGAGWAIDSDQGRFVAGSAVVAAGPWSNGLLRDLGVRMPLFIKRGYHMHYGLERDRALRNWLLDIETGYLVSPMQRGVRLTTGAEFAPLDSGPTPLQLDGCEAVARRLLPLAERRDSAPWLGARPCTPDMKPVIGEAKGHPGLWLALGHAHHGFTLGPVTGRVLAEEMSGEVPLVPLAPFSPGRFQG